MNRKITDPDVQLLAGIATMLQGDYVDDDEWEDSPFDWIKKRPSRQRGKIGEQLVSGWCAAKGLSVGPSGDTQADKVIQGQRVEIKFSTLWQTGIFKFQQVRDQDYQFLICLGISPFDAKCWIIPKDVLYNFVIGHTGQHGGAASRETAWISFRPEQPPTWLENYGGSLAQAFEIIREL